MKFAVVCCLALLVVVAAADSGHFIPKAFYTMDAEGHMSDVHPISPHTANYLRRMRRQISVSSTGASSSNGGPVKFSHTQTVFDPQESSRSGSPGKGHVVSTTGEIDESGKVIYKTEEGFFDAIQVESAALP